MSTTYSDKATEITERHEKFIERRQPLIDRFDRDFELWRLSDDALTNGINKDLREGEYDRMVSNLPAVLANKVIEMLSDSRLLYSYPIETEKTKGEKARLSQTERFVYGCLNAADMRLLSYTLPTVQDLIAWHTTLRGWVAVRCVFTGKKDNIAPDIAVWDMRNTSYVCGSNGLLSATYCRLADKDQIEAEYGKSFQADYNNNVKVYDSWDWENECVVIDGEIVHKLKHGLGRLPVFISNVGSTPIVQSEYYGAMQALDTIAQQGESIFVNTRTMYPSINRLMSYYITTVGLGTRAPAVVYYEGAQPPDLDSNPYVKGNVIFLQKDKQEIKEYFKPTMPDDAARLMGIVQGMINTGGMPPISYGETQQALPAAGISMLIHSAQSILNPRRKTMERAFQWIAMELIRQFKGGRYGNMTLFGTDSLNYDFKVDAKASDLVDDRLINCKIEPNMPQDALQNAGIAAQLKTSALMSTQTLQDRYLDVADTDAEMARIRVEMGENDEFVRYFRLASDMLEAGERESAELFLMKAMLNASMVKQQAQQMMQPPQIGGNVPPVTGVPQGARPTGGIPANPVNDARRLQSIGLVRGQ